MTIDYDDIKQMAVDEGRPIKTLIALAPANDPFYAGCPAPKAQGEWFAALYNRFMSGVARFHIRRIHYLLISQPRGTVLNIKGEPYENIESDYNDLGNASQYARYLRLVPIEDFEDRRNPDPVLHLPDVPDEPETVTWCDKPKLLETLPVPTIGVEALCVVAYRTLVRENHRLGRPRCAGRRTRPKCRLWDGRTLAHRRPRLNRPHRSQWRPPMPHLVRERL